MSRRDANDDAPGCERLTSLMEVLGMAGEEVLLRVGGFSFNSGTGTLTLTPTIDYPWDLDDNGSVGATDLLALLVNWGPCP